MLRNLSKLKDNKGMTLVETLAVIVITFITIYTVNSFNVTLANHKKTISRHTSLNRSVESEISDFYSKKDWESLDLYQYTAKHGDEEILVKVDYNLTGHNTDKLVVNFTLNNGYSKEYSIERSIYHEQ